MTQQPATYAMEGGLDLTSAALAVSPGRLIAAMNYEPLAEGYGRVAGFERYNGKVEPSSLRPATITFRNGATPIYPGNVIVGAISGARAYVLLEPYGFAGIWDQSTGTGTLIVSEVEGTFQPNENLLVNGVPRAISNGPLVLDSAPTEELRTAWTIATRERQRGQIGPVPGIGPVRGVSVLRNTVYAWRDQDETRAAMFAATPTGWTEVLPTWMIPFTAGMTEIAEGETIKDNQTPAATAIARRVVVLSGSWTGGTAAGYVVISNRSKQFTVGPLRDASGTQVAAVQAVDSRVAFRPGGRYDTIGHNFYGAANRYRMYGAYGAGQGFEFDGTVVVPIVTGMADDRPTRVAEIAQQLILTFPGGSVQFSGTGEPLLWQPIVGAGEFGLGDEITDIMQSAETAVVIFGVKKVSVLSGNDSANFTLTELSEEAGAEPWTAQRIATGIYLDRRGLRTISATSAFGNFKTGTLTEEILPYFTAKRAAGAYPVASMTCKAKGHYRLFWSDGTGLSVYMGRKRAESIPFGLNGVIPYCSTTAEMDDGTEGLFIGAEDGFVYRLDSGPSFDGTGVEGFAMLPFNHIRSPMINKRFHLVSMEMVAAPTTRIGITTQINYGDGSQPSAGRDFTIEDGGRSFTVQGGGGAWDATTWSGFFWSSAFEGTANCEIDGIGRNISILIGAQSSALEEPHILQAYTIFYSPRGLNRTGS